MKASPDCLALLVEFEGYRREIYRDAAGWPTIGFGHRMRQGEAFEALDWSDALRLLDADVSRVAEDVTTSLMRYPVTQGQFDALVAFAFNVGISALLGSTLLKLLKDGEVELAGNEFLDWDKAHENGRLVEVPGLLRRREAERLLFLKPDDLAAG